jgi:hypothetical protein
MTHCIVLDLSQNRMGKIKIPHNSAFELRNLSSQVTETPRGSIAFLQPDGTVLAVNFNFSALAPDSVMLLGKYQYVRQRMLELFEVELENVKAGADFEIEGLASLDGKNLAEPQVGYLQDADGNYRDYTFDGLVGTNVSLMFKGRFNILSLILWFAPHGRK